jgi:hypothetical protein
MKRITDREIRRLLSARGVPEPPPHLADRIKGEIPDVLQVGGPEPRPEGVRGFPSRTLALRRSWLLAASLLVVIGAGFVAVRVFAPTSDLAREIALGGVVRIKDVVVTVPERSTVETMNLAKSGVPHQAVALESPSAPKSAAKGFAAKPALTESAPVTASRPTGSLALTITDGREPVGGAAITATRTDDQTGARRTTTTGADGRAELRRLPPGTYQVRSEMPGFQDAGTTVRVAGGAEDSINLAMAPKKVAEEVSVAGAFEPRSRMMAAQSSVNEAPAAASRESVSKGSIVVTVHDSAGQPLPEATVLLTFSDQPAVGCGFRTTGKAGVATFCCVIPHTYRVCAQLRGFAPTARDGIVVSTGRQLDVEITMERSPADGGEHPWTCPTPKPAGHP